MNRIRIVVATAVAIVMGGLAAFGETWTDAKGVTWDFYADYTDDNVLEAEITGVSPAPSGLLTIPSKVVNPWGDSCTVTTIGVSAFEAKNAITAVSIPASVKVIDTFAFKGCTGLTSVVIPASVTNIDSYAFADCSNLKSVTFKGDAPSFSDFHGAFEGTPFLAGLEARNGHDDRDNPKMISGTSGELKDENFAASCYGSGYDLINDFAPDGDATKWYEWTAPKSGTVWFWAQGNFNTFLGACTYDTIIMDDLAHNDNFNGKASAISFSVKAGAKYWIYVGGIRPRHLGSYTLKWRLGAPVNVTFDTCGGNINDDSGAAVFPVPKGAAAGALPTAMKEYYTLAGWYTKKSGGTKVTAKTKFSKATKVYAHWAKKKFKVTVAKGDGAKATTGSGSYAWGKKVKLTATPKPGYVFWMWELNDLSDEVSKAAFPNFSKLCRKNLKPTVIVPKTSGISYRATFVKKSLDTLALVVYSGSTTLYAEDGAGYVDLWAQSSSYAAFTASKLPAGVKFAFRPNSDSVCRLEIVNPDKVPAGRHVIKVTAKNRSGRTAAKSIVVFGKNRTQAIDEGALSMSGSMSAKTPNALYVGVKHGIHDLGVSAESGWKITKVSGLPSGITWDAKSQKLKGYATKAGTYTFTFTAAKGKTTYAATATFEVLALPAKIVGTFYGYTPNEYGFFSSQSLKVTASVTSAGKVSAKIGGLSFSCNGLTYNAAGNKFNANMKSSVAKSKTVTYTRSVALEFDPVANYSENSLNGAYYEYTTKKASGSVTEELVAQHEIFGRRNVLSCDANGNLVFDGAEIVYDALDWALSNSLGSSPVTNAEDVMATINSNYDGTVKLVGTYYGKTISESAVVWYEPVNATIAYIRIYSFNLGMQVTYKVTIVNDSAGPYVDTVDPPAVPAG